MFRPWERFDWSLRSCGLRGHVTYAPTEPSLRDRLHVAAPAGEAWRCLRCGTYVLGEPHASGPAAEAPLVLRGAALKDAFILRLLAVERLLRGFGLVLLAVGIVRFDGARTALQRMLDTYLPLLKPVADKIGYDLLESGPVTLARKAFALNHDTLLLAALAVGLYAALQLGEGVGLWLMRRWGEYLAVVGTSLFVPLEVYELVEKRTVLRVAALLVNLAAVAYLVWSKRLFGVRGGRAAFEAERHEASLLEVETAAVSSTSPRAAAR